ncbi:MAG TPA: histone deacetylase [Bryobacteraceae bacterium]|nr:histone deacetylase [Bryobacteraceae bacterium]
MTGLAADPACKEHQTGTRHPERPERFDAALGSLDGLALLSIEPRVATEDEISLCHPLQYIRLVEREVNTGFHELSTGDTTISARSLDAASRATGAALNAVDAVFDKKVQNAFCIVRPPGHHATPTKGMGFCLFNTIAIAARYAQRKYGIERVLIADWDVHHGNGTQDIFYSDGSVFFFSTHQHPWYPGTGAPGETGQGAGAGMTMNCPFPAGSGRREILGAFEQMLAPAAKKVKPELVLISAGFDSRIDDPLGNFLLNDADFVDLTRVMLEIANQYAGGRVVSVLEGGYSLTGLASAVRSHVQALMEA